MFTGIIEAIKGLVLKKNSDGSASFERSDEDTNQKNTHLTAFR